MRREPYQYRFEKTTGGPEPPSSRRRVVLAVPGALAGSRHRPDEVHHASRRFPSRRVPRHRDPPALGGGQARGVRSLLDPPLESERILSSTASSWLLLRGLMRGGRWGQWALALCYAEMCSRLVGIPSRGGNASVYLGPCLTETKIFKSLSH